MKSLRRHWYDLGGLLSIVVLIYCWTHVAVLSQYELLMWLSLASLFLHQLEEYRMPGTFPGMINTVMFRSAIPDRYPLNTNTAMIINVLIGWLFYFLAAVFGERAIWPGIATMLVSAGNFIAHTFLFNIKGRTFYNAGLLTSWLLFLPCVLYFIHLLRTEALATGMDYWIGIPLGIVLNVVGVLQMIGWLKDKDTAYIFDQRNLLPRDRK